ncbi:MAG: class I SAM-dependent methyltransferase [Gammaproteobacteria bacterium]|nr:class I SAM-dependent methyltransferase [Gammaproteobacteria bacterium]
MAAATAADETRARALAAELRLPYEPVATLSGLGLIVRDGALELFDSRARGSHPMRVDFVSGKLRHRRLHGGGELLRKVLGRPDEAGYVLDAGAGLGADSFVMATLGYLVVALERSPIIHALLADGLARAGREPELEVVVARIKLVRADALEFLGAISDQQRPRVIHLDPMYPSRRKSALGRLDLRLVRAVVGDDPDANELLAVARQQAKKRVVVKRPLRAAPLGAVPASQIVGKSVRYDLYPA